MHIAIIRQVSEVALPSQDGDCTGGEQGDHYIWLSGWLRAHDTKKGNGAKSVASHLTHPPHSLQDTTIAVWSRERFERLQILYHHRNTVIGIEIVGRFAYSACLDGTHKAFSIDFKKLCARKNGFQQRRYSFRQQHSNEEFREDVDFSDDRTGKVYPAHWRDHDHMHTVAGVIVILVYVAEDSEFRPFHVLSTRREIIL